MLVFTHRKKIIVKIKNCIKKIALKKLLWGHDLEKWNSTAVVSKFEVSALDVNLRIYGLLKLVQGSQS